VKGAFEKDLGVVFHGGQALVFGEAEGGHECGYVVGSAMGVGVAGVAADHDVLSVGGLDEIDHVRHGDHPCVFVEHGGVLYFEVFALAESLVHGISFEHEGQFRSQIEGDDVVVLS
jgi:hypothetical protein